MKLFKPFIKALITNKSCYIYVFESYKYIDRNDHFPRLSFFSWFEIKHISINNESITFELSDEPYDLPSKIKNTSLENIYLSDIESVFDDSVRILKSHEIKENPDIPISKIQIINSRNVRID